LTPPARRAPDDAFEELFSATHERLGAAARRMIPDHHDAADVVQETYLKAWKALPHFRGDAHVFTWLYAILLNTARTFLRRRRPEPVDDETHELVETDPLAHPEGWTDHQGLRDEMVAAVSALPPRLRSVTERDLNGYCMVDVADELGISVGAAKVRLHRARRVLRERVA
jgi:RNA polymerase sigma-70 factor (ECF subfamily)